METTKVKILKILITSLAFTFTLTLYFYPFIEMAKLVDMIMMILVSIDDIHVSHKIIYLLSFVVGLKHNVSFGSLQRREEIRIWVFFLKRP